MTRASQGMPLLSSAAITDSHWREVLREINCITAPADQQKLAVQVAGSDTEIFDAGFSLALAMAKNVIHRLAQFE